MQIVNAVGGVDIDITEMEAKALNWEVALELDAHRQPRGPGPQPLRRLHRPAVRPACARSTTTWHRIERQRTVIQAVLDQIQNASVTELDNLLNTMLPLVQTNFTKTEIAALLVQLAGLLWAAM